MRISCRIACSTPLRSLLTLENSTDDTIERPIEYIMENFIKNTIEYSIEDFIAVMRQVAPPFILLLKVL